MLDKIQKCYQPWVIEKYPPKKAWAGNLLSHKQRKGVWEHTEDPLPKNLPLFSSKIGGLKPTIFEDEGWPTCDSKFGSCGRPLTFLCQINFNDIKDPEFQKLYGNGLLQVWACLGPISERSDGSTYYPCQCDGDRPSLSVRMLLQDEMENDKFEDGVCDKGKPPVVLEEDVYTSFEMISQHDMPSNHFDILERDLAISDWDIEPWFLPDYDDSLEDLISRNWSPTIGRLGGWFSFFQAEPLMVCPDCYNELEERKKTGLIDEIRTNSIPMPYMQPLFCLTLSSFETWNVDRDPRLRASEIVLGIFQCPKHLEYVDGTAIYLG
ncbi:hypothetical protein K7432_011212 [Basidiobolus ranarum]|uniref:Uncharacterized protein n=1 Tax=Basidiobolus ranarum TaxID=34480 RepID=A0ABR2VU84_9FUNG